MIRFNRTTEYGLMALRHIGRKQNYPQTVELSSAREIADAYGLPFEITAKTLQRLKEVGLIQSTQGARGGYQLSRIIEETNLAQFVDWMEGNTAIVACVESKHPSCEYLNRCDIHHLMGDLNSKISGFLSGIPLMDFVLRASAPQQERNAAYAAH